MEEEAPPRDEQGDKFIGMGRRMEKITFPGLVLLGVLCRDSRRRQLRSFGASAAADICKAQGEAQRKQPGRCGSETRDGTRPKGRPTRDDDERS
jgi:hypothetical protein